VVVIARIRISFILKTRVQIGLTYWRILFIVVDQFGPVRVCFRVFQEVDMAAAFIPALPGLDNIVKWGIELTQFQYVVLMKRPKESATGSGLLAPFETEVRFFFFFVE